MREKLTETTSMKKWKKKYTGQRYYRAGEVDKGGKWNPWVEKDCWGKKRAGEVIHG